MVNPDLGRQYVITESTLDLKAGDLNTSSQWWLHHLSWEILFVLSFIEQLVTKPFCVPGSLPDSGLPELSKTEKPSAPCGAPAHPV